jgi:tripartite-type tricarboxylate transporter receptor subunit TctC
VTTAKRSKVLPDVPTMAEAGLAGYGFTTWAGIAAPAGTPKPIVDALYAAIAGVLATGEARAWFDSFGADPGGDRPDALAALIRAEYAKHGEVIRSMGLKVD